MKILKKALALTAIIFGCWMIITQMDGKLPPRKSPQHEAHRKIADGAASNESAAVRNPKSSTRVPAQAEPSTTNTVLASKSDSIVDMTKTLKQFSDRDSRLGNLVQYLESSRQEPALTHTANPYTGEMVIVRTKNPLEGTRYFHAQYFADASKQSFMQHMSFEIQPGPRAMDQAVEAIHKTYPGLKEPRVQNAGFAKWDLPDGYTLWVQKMNADDLQDSPFNAYTPADVGTVRVAVEIEIHDTNGEDAHTH